MIGLLLFPLFVLIVVPYITKAVEAQGFYYAPDPSSQIVCSIGGNVAENSGGAHCLKYGFTVNHVLGLQAVTGAGELVWLGGHRGLESSLVRSAGHPVRPGG